jgi:hypothetical protein
VFKVANSWANPPGGGQQGFPAIGAGAQTTGAPFAPPAGDHIEWSPIKTEKGRRTFFGLRGTPNRGVDGQQGFPPVEDYPQARPPGSMPNVPPIGPPTAIMVETPQYSRGAAAFVPNFGKTLTNPIGAGVVACYTPQASYGRSAQYIQGQLWWTSQDIPTSIHLQGLTDPEALAAVLDGITVQAVMREP